MTIRSTVALLLVTGTLIAAGCRREPAKGRSVVLISVDTLRADRVDLYDASRVRTPHISAIGSAGAVVANAVTPVGRTTQAVATILTGQHPLRHGVQQLDSPVPPEARTLAEWFHAAGYATAAFLSNVNLAPGKGFEQGFDAFKNPGKRWVGDSGEAINAEVDEWLGARAGDRPLFLWVHYLEPHWAYEPPMDLAHLADPDWDDSTDVLARVRANEFTLSQLMYQAPTLIGERAIEHLRRLYDAEVLAIDATIGRLQEILARHGLSDDAVWVFTSDHGEALGEHEYWFGHGDYLYDETLRVPLLFRAPGLVPPGTRLDGVASLEDLAPTLLALSGAVLPPPAPGAPPEMDGRDLAPQLLAGGTATIPARDMIHFNDDQHVPTESVRHAVAGRAGRWFGLRQQEWVLLRVPQAEGRVGYELYDTRRDPVQRQDLTSTEAQRVQTMRAILDPLVAAQGGGSPGDSAGRYDPRLRDSLKALGYIEDR